MEFIVNKISNRTITINVEGKTLDDIVKEAYCRGYADGANYTVEKYFPETNVKEEA